MKVLIIEEGFSDSPNVAAILQEDWNVLTVPTVERGLEFIQRERPDMVFWGPNLSGDSADLMLKMLSLQESYMNPFDMN